MLCLLSALDGSTSMASRKPIFSNALFHSRMPSRTAERYSSGYFHGPDLRTPLEPLPLGPEFAAAVAASPRHAGAGFMAKRHELLAGQGGTSSTSADVYGQQLWNYYLRSYPDNVRAHYPDRAD